MRCKCGNDRFYAHQCVRLEVIVDEVGSFNSNMEDIAAAIYDSEDPYGPYVCTKCGAEYDSLSEQDMDRQLKCKIVARAQRMGIATGDHLSQMMDVDFAHMQFHMRLKDWLDAGDHDFAHDFCGIQRHIDRATGLVNGYFLPRFAGKGDFNESTL